MEIKSSLRNYKVNFIENLYDSIVSIYNPNDVIFVDENVTLPILPKEFKVIKLTVSEFTKSLENIPNIIDNLPKGFNKTNKLIAIGGGITQDVISFVSSILFRGIDWVFYPTTLLSQGDSCIGGKTSINYKNSKNQLGGFYPPQQIFIDPDFIKTLPSNDITSGLGEMLHFYLTSSRKDYKYFLDNKSKLKLLTKRCLKIKKHFIEIDEFDKGERLLLNYGHTFGHAIEGVTRYNIPHGIAVSLGMDIANFISWKLGYLSGKDYLDIKKTLKEIYGSNKVPSPIKMIPFLKKDKKNTTDQLTCVLTQGPGKMFLHQLDYDVVLKYINEYNQ